MDGVMCYLDDILIFASDSKTHDRILRLVLRKLKEAKVTLNKAKCVFGVPRINFLGHILDEDGIRPDPAKIEAVAKMPAPTDVHGVRRFLGMVNHLGRFVENLSEIVAPLNQLLVKGQDFVWDCSQERAFRKLKELLTTQPILAAYDVRKPTMVSSDASSYGMGAVLKQEVIIAVYACGVDVEKGPIRQQLWNAPPCDNVESWFGAQSRMIPGHLYFVFRAL
ncbi:K02A2.6-like [Cordylochernes scorpioides]|uniref:K02A2.6-like n=1 Tax=Cordylochernes scorpioides TaxID=51811 RepID=A0ABY6JYP5_9ARAC|nr:K02A2.6-like [Cordylochernes scorpioides]